MKLTVKPTNVWREELFFICLLATVVVFPFSEAFVSIMSALLLLQALVLRSWKHPLAQARTNKSLFLLFSIFALYLIGTIFTNDFHFALYELKKVVFWIITPLAFYLSPRLSDRKFFIVLLVFVISVLLSSLIITFQVLISQKLQLTGFRSAGFISHIRFSYQVVLALILIAWFVVSGRFRMIKGSLYFAIAVFLSLGIFLIVLKSLLGIIAFIGTFGTVLLYYLFRINQRKIRMALFACVVIFMGVPGYYLGNVLADFYTFHDEPVDSMEWYSAAGNRYNHDFENQIRENGYLVYTYLCEDELRQEWNKRSKIDYDQLLNGFPLGVTLVRYLTSLGYRKDSVGISELTDKDVALIEAGVTNYKFDRSGFSIYPRIYETVWELHYYLKTGDPNNKSLAQRIEFVKASLSLIKENPLFGIGTGNWVQKFNEVYDRTGSKLLPEKRGSSHNQYLNYMVKFGIIGFCWILFALLFPFFYEGHRSNFIFILFLLSYAFANFGDSNLETHMGLSFFSFFYVLFLWNSTDEMKRPLVIDGDSFSDRLLPDRN